MQSIRYRGRARHSDQEREAIVAGSERSALTQAAYCAQAGITVATLANWKRRLRGRLSESETMGSSGFMEVTRMVTSMTRPAEVRIVIESGPVKLALPMGVPASWLAELVRGLQCGV